MNVAWPADTFAATAENIADKITARVSSAAGLMHQPGFLGDCLVVDDESGQAKYHETIAVDYIQESEFARHAHYYIITMEYGEFDGDIFNKERVPDAAKGYDDAYLHPRIRRMSRGRLISEHHISESVENDWRVGKHPGERPLILSIDFIGQTDASQYQQTHRDQLLYFPNQQLALGSPAESELPPLPACQSLAARSGISTGNHSTGS